jgi:hypothetical protein
LMIAYVNNPEATPAIQMVPQNNAIRSWSSDLVWDVGLVKAGVSFEFHRSSCTGNLTRNKTPEESLQPFVEHCQVDHASWKKPSCRGATKASDIGSQPFPQDWRLPSTKPKKNLKQAILPGGNKPYCNVDAPWALIAIPLAVCASKVHSRRSSTHLDTSSPW